MIVVGSFLIIFLGSFLIIFCGLGLYLTWYREDKTNLVPTIVCSIGFLIGLMAVLAWVFRYTDSEKSLKNNTVKIEVRQELLNGQIVSTDTVYIFTPKKDKK